MIRCNLSTPSFVYVIERKFKKKGFDIIMKQELTEGLIIKNYKVLCEEYLGVKPTKGNSRKYHYKELERYCE